jgi:hypothetical protein
MNNTSKQVVVIDARNARPAANLLPRLWRGEIAALRIQNLVSSEACIHLSQRLSESTNVVDHADVQGLRVVGFSHFQAVRKPELMPQYLEDGQRSPGALRELASPYGSPFDSALGFLNTCWQAGCQLMALPSEGALAPFTVRIYNTGVGIDPHQDILSAESPQDPTSHALTMQFGANLYIAMPHNGGDLELFDTDYSLTNYKDLSEGPRTFSREKLGAPVLVRPAMSEMILFPSHRVHAVSPSQGKGLRVTISFFIGVVADDLPLRVWA